MSMTITNVDTGSIGAGPYECQDETVSFTAEDTYVAGTILARKTAASVSAGTVQGGTGTGTLTAVGFADGDVVPIAGVYVLTCIEAVAHGGVFKLVDPNGAIVAGYIPMTVGSGLTTTWEAGGLTGILTDATDFIAGNYFEITVVGGSKLVPYALAGTGGAQIPVAVATYDLYKASSGDLSARVLVSGKVNKNRLILDADGDDSNITAAVLDKLRRAGIHAVDVVQLGSYDTQD